MSENSSFQFEMPQHQQSIIKVIGVGGGGCNAVNTMIKAGLTGVEYIVANTDSQALDRAKDATILKLGDNLTKGLGAGANPEVGRLAAIEDRVQIAESLQNTDLLFITAGMGGGTGTGAAPVIACAARERGILTVAVITKPFEFEGQRRMKQADEGIEEFEFVGALFQGRLYEVFHQFLGAAHVALEVAESHLRLDHPELG